MITNNEFYENYTAFSIYIDRMRDKLLKAIGGDKKRDFSEQWDIIEKLERLQHSYHAMFHYTQIVDNQSGKLLMGQKQLLDKNLRLEKENESLKTNLTL